MRGTVAKELKAMGGGRRTYRARKKRYMQIKRGKGIAPPSRENPASAISSRRRK